MAFIYAAIQGAARAAAHFALIRRWGNWVEEMRAFKHRVVTHLWPNEKQPPSTNPLKPLSISELADDPDKTPTERP